MYMYFLFGFAEVVLYAFKAFIEDITNQYFAVTQMEIKTGFLYGDVIKAVNFVWAVCAIAVLVVAVIYYFNNKENKE